MSALRTPGEAIRSLVLYVPRDNPIYRLHPVTKISLIISATMVAYALQNIVYIVLFNLLLAAAIAYARIPLRSLKPFITAITWFLVLIVVSNTFIAKYPGTVFLKFSFFGLYDFIVTDGNILFGLSFALRLLVMALTSALLIITTKQRDLVYGLRNLGIPYTLIFIIALSLRSLITFAVDISTIMEAEQSRALDFTKGHIVSRLMKLAMIGVPLTVISIKRIEFLTNAVETRAFRSGVKRTFYHDIKFSKGDYVVLPAITAITAIVLILSYLRLA